MRKTRPDPFLRELCLQSAPVAVGGLGGSGTRLVAEMLARTGCYIGSDMNHASDNLWFTLLFKRPEVLKNSTLTVQSLTLFFKIMNNKRLSCDEMNYLSYLDRLPVADFNIDWSALRVNSIRKLAKNSLLHGGYWGWKEPNTHLYLDSLLHYVPSIKYIHVMRHGLDMAFSSNKTQLWLWGNHILADKSNSMQPDRALRYWIVVHERIRKLAARYPEQVMLLNYDDLCRYPEAGVDAVEKFLMLTLSESCRRDLLAMPKLAPVARYRQFGHDCFEMRDIDCVRGFGFSVD